MPSKKTKPPAPARRRALSLRLPDGLHGHVAAYADRERRSLNQQIILFLESASGYTGTKKAGKPKSKCR